MKKIVFVVVVIALIAFGAYQYLITSAVPDETAHTAPETMPSLGARLAGTRIVIKNPLLAPGTQKISFEFYGKDGHPFGENDIKIAHEKKIHLIIVSDDFSSYQHVHPSYANGAWETDVEFKNNTAYQAYFDSDPVEEEPQVLRMPLSIGTPAPANKVSQEKNTVTVAGVTTSLTVRQPVMSGSALAFSLTQNGARLVAEPHLGAEGHVVAISHADPDNFVHVHPVTHEGVDTDVDFSLDVPVSGTYTLFAQFKTNGVVRMFPFTLAVVRDANAAENTDTHAETDAAGGMHGETSQ